MDSGEIAGLLRRGRVLLPNLERLLGELEQFAGRTVQDMSIDLDFTRRQVDKMTVHPLGPHVIKDPIPTPHKPREIIPIPDPKPAPDIMAIDGFALGPLITSPGDIPGLSNILRSADSETPGGIPSPDDLRGKDPGDIHGPPGSVEKPTRGGSGRRIFIPGTGEADVIRVMSGNPNDPNPVKRGPYARISRGGWVSDPIPLAGNPTL
jgi:hypothetical protein